MFRRQTLKPYMLLCLLLVFCMTLSYGQTQWSLEKCIEYAQQNNLTIKQSEIAIQQSSLTLEQSKKARYPNLSGGMNYGYNVGRSINPITNEFVTNDINTNGFNLSVNAQLYSGGSISKNIQKNQMDMSSAKLDLDQSKQDIGLSVANAYLQILLSIEQLKNAENQLVQSKNQLEQTNRLIAAGSLPEGEKYTLEAQIARDEQSVISSQNSVDLNYINLKILLQLDPYTKFEIEQPDIAVPAPENLELISMESIFKRSEAFQPNIRSGEIKKQSAELGVDIAKAGMRPSVSVFGSTGTNYSSLSFNDAGYFAQLEENLNGSVGLNVNIPIYDRGQTKTNIEQARLGVIRQNIANQQLRQNLKSDIQQAYANALAAAKQFRAARITVEANEKAFEITEKRFKVGVSNSFEYTTAQDNLNAARFNLSIAKYDYLFKLKVLDFYQGKKISIK